MSQHKNKQIQKTKLQKTTVRKKNESAQFSKQQLLILLALLVAIFIAYLPALNKDFINYDDDLYITKNPNIANFSFSHLPYIFSSFYEAQYSPVPTLVYGLIRMATGFNPFLYNLIAVLMHLITTMLVFKFIWSLGQNFRVAFATAALFGIATLQVESVAWLAAVYKTCLYSIFFLSSLILYVQYLKTKKIRYFILSILMFFISCFCKEQAVSLSLAIVATDIYYKRKLISRKVILEKLPYFLISLAFGLVTMAATKSNKDIIITTTFGFYDRMIYASYALCMYIVKLFVPFKLSLYYPYFSLHKSMALYLLFPLALLILCGLYAWAIKMKNKFIIFGGLFFLINMIFSLALQVVAVRPTVMADRYVYLGSIGIFFMVAAGLNRLMEKKLVKPVLVMAAFIVFFFITSVLTYSRNKVWKNTISITTDVVDKYPVPLMWVNRGYEYRQRKEYDKALADYNNAIQTDPTYALAFHNRGALYFFTNKDSLAILDFNRALELDPKNPETWGNRGSALARTGHYEDALKDFNIALQLNPNKENTYSNRALTYEMLGRYEEAIADYYQYLKIKPDDASIYNNIGVNKQRLKKFKESLEDFDKAINLDPSGIYYLSRSYSWYGLQDKSRALADALTAQKSGAEVNPAYLKALQP
ncbi:MAG TPA: tetratricopeptide repeat protein [Bacteroidales bacterium]|nr:tetratricopeptide repeat protein [Bacteroidales bacterium]